MYHQVIDLGSFSLFNICTHGYCINAFPSLHSLTNYSVDFFTVQLLYLLLFLFVCQSQT
jgi:hypothetical protein